MTGQIFKLWNCFFTDFKTWTFGYLRTLSSMENVPLRSGLHTSTVKMLVLTIPLLMPTRILRQEM